MSKIFGNNWKTTVGGIVGFLAQIFVPLLTNHQAIPGG